MVWNSSARRIGFTGVASFSNNGLTSGYIPGGAHFQALHQTKNAKPFAVTSSPGSARGYRSGRSR